MTTLATALKTEIAQAAQKTLRDETQALRKATSAYEREISALQRRVTTLEQFLARMNQAGAGQSGITPANARRSGASAAAVRRANGATPSARVRAGRRHAAHAAPAAAGRAGNEGSQAGAPDVDPQGPTLRFSAKGFTKLRQRLGLSAAALGTLLGVTAQSVYKWEDGKARPRAAQLQAIAAVRKLGKREAAARLAEIEGTSESAQAPQAAEAAGA